MHEKSSLKKIQMQKVEHDRRTGSRCEYIEPNVKESALLYDGDELVGVYFQSLPEKYEKLEKLMAVANHEFLSDRVPKDLLERSDVMILQKKLNITRAKAKKIGTVQQSTIIGSIPKKPHMRRDYHNRSRVHAVKSAETFIKAMLMATKEVKVIMGDYLPEQLREHSEAVEGVDENYRFGELFTSSISNFNISAPFHRDRANIKNTLNAIYTHRHNADGGCLYVPDYDACFDMPTGSLLLYPAWRNVHAVTPIVPTHDGGYRNSLVFYALKGFLND